MQVRLITPTKAYVCQKIISDATADLYMGNLRTVVYINEGHILQVIPVKRGAISADNCPELR